MEDSKNSIDLDKQGGNKGRTLMSANMNKQADNRRFIDSDGKIVK